MPDVLFVQEYSSVLLEYLKKIDIYDITIDKEKDSLVALNKKVYPSTLTLLRTLQNSVKNINGLRPQLSQLQMELSFAASI